MSERHNIIAFLATLIAIVILVLSGATLSIYNRPVEALGIGGAVTGLIGVLGTFRPRAAPDVQDVNFTGQDRPVTVKETKK